MESGGNAAFARSGEWEMGGIVTAPAGSPRVRLRGGWRRDARSVRAARRGRGLRLAELRRVRLVAADMSVRLLALAMAFWASVATAGAQEIDRTLPSQLSAPTRATLERLIDSARVAGLPVDPLYSKVREGGFRAAEGPRVGAAGEEPRVVAAVQRLTRDLGDARSALGDSAGAEEIAAGANALRAGLHPADL